MNRPLKYSTPQRIAQYETLRSAGLSKVDYRLAIRKLNKAEMSYRAAQKLKEKKREEEDARRRAAAEATAAARAAAIVEADKKKRAEKNAKRRERIKANKAARAIPASLLEFSVTVGENVEGVVYDIWKRTKGTTIRVLSNQQRVRERDEEKDYFDKVIEVGTGDKGYKEFRLRFLTEYDGNWLIKEEETLLVMKSNTIEPARLFQRFRDGITHCVFTPILAKLGGGGSASYVKKQAQRHRAVMKLKALYEDGVPEDKMNDVARAAGMKIAMFDVFGNELAVYNEKSMGAVVRMTNTRENHVDIGLVVDSDPVSVDQTEMNTLWMRVRESGDFYMVDGDFVNGCARRLRTLEGSWCVSDPVADACKAFDKELGIMNYKINARKQPMLNAFLKAGCIINAWSCKLEGGEATGCADMPKAYAQFKKCHMYRGFIGHVHQFRSGEFDRAFVEEHLGYYQVRVVGGVNPLMERLGMLEGLVLVLFSPELLYFMDEGLNVDIVQGAWGSRFDFDFSDEMLTDRKYCIWSGRLGMEREESTHTIPCSSKAWAAHLATEYKVHHWSSSGLLTIRQPSKSVYTAHHILGAVTAYTRIQMMEAMKQFEPSQLVRVVLDGIYYRGEKPSALDWFADKKVLKDDGYSGGWYSHKDLALFPLMGKIRRNTLLTGQGGSGKTYSVFNDAGFNTVLFVSPSHVLGQDVSKKYGVRYTTIHKLIGIECCPYYQEQRVPSVILIDEITQLPAEWVSAVFKLYSESLILLAGDIDAEGRWYQCRSGDGSNWSEIWKPVGVDVIEFLDDRRSRDDKLKKLKLDIRDAMRMCDLDCGVYEMENWAKLLPVSKMDFQVGDTCIAATHRTNEALLKLGIVSGWYKTGGYVSDVELLNYKKRGSFTIHSYQGKTIETGRVWICIDDMFEYAMLYTAVSRAVSFDQIRFFRSKDL